MVKLDRDNVGELTDHEKLVSQVGKWAETSKEDANIWRDKQDKWYRLRMRVKKSKDKPFVGCANLRLPTLDTKIKKLKSDIMQSVFSIRPVVQVIPNPGANPETATKIEKFLDHLIMDKTDIKKKAVIAIDQELQKGFYLLKPYWNIEVVGRSVDVDVEGFSEEEKILIFDPTTPRDGIVQFLAIKNAVDASMLVAEHNAVELDNAVSEILAGKQSVTMKLKDVISNQPDIALVDPEKLYVPSETGFDPQSALYLVHEFYITYNQLVQNVDNKNWDKSSLDKISWSMDRDPESTDITKQAREGVQMLKTKGYIKVQECYCYWDINGDGKDEKCVVTISPDFNVMFRAIELPFDNYKFPFVKLFYELTDDRWYSHRGLPELIEDMVKEIDIQHMQRIDSQTLRNSPMFLYRAGQVKGQSKNFGFGRGIPVSGMQQLEDIIRPFSATNTNAEYSYKDEQQMLEMRINELIGQVDFGLQSQINRREPRTAEEVQMQVASSSANFSLDADMHRQQFQELFNWIWELWCQYGDESYTFNYFGEGKFEPITLNREEVQGKYLIKVRANDQNFNPEIRQAKATAILRDTYQALQFGLVGPEAAIAARMNALRELGVENPELYAQPPQPRQPQPQVQPIIIRMEDLSNGEIAQVLASQGIEIDTIGRRITREKQDDKDTVKALIDAQKAIK